MLLCHGFVMLGRSPGVDVRTIEPGRQTVWPPFTKLLLENLENNKSSLS
jgi:hypothetical protein